MLFNSKDLKGKQEELKKTAYLEHLVELGKVDVSDLDMDVVGELQEVLESLNYITEYENDYLVFKNVEERKQIRINEVRRKLLKNKGGAGGYTYRVSLPVDFVRELDLEQGEEVILSTEDNAIVIRRP